jgi:hypothetical protein
MYFVCFVINNILQEPGLQENINVVKNNRIEKEKLLAEEEKRDCNTC